MTLQSQDSQGVSNDHALAAWPGAGPPVASPPGTADKRQTGKKRTASVPHQLSAVSVFIFELWHYYLCMLPLTFSWHLQVVFFSVSQICFLFDRSERGEGALDTAWLLFSAEADDEGHLICMFHKCHFLFKRNRVGQLCLHILWYASIDMKS